MVVLLCSGWCGVQVFSVPVLLYQSVLIQPFFIIISPLLFYLALCSLRAQSIAALLGPVAALVAALGTPLSSKTLGSFARAQNAEALPTTASIPLPPAILEH